jgi:aryl-phospho-beta-D-glucosidase BglC (GH1 family)
MYCVVCLLLFIVLVAPYGNAAVDAQTISELKNSLQSVEWKDREEAAYQIEKLGPEAKETVPVLIECLSDEEWKVRKAAAIALTSMGIYAQPAVDALIKALNDYEWHVRKPAAQALAAIGPAAEPAVPELIEALNDIEWHVRKPAAEALAAIGKPSKPAIPELIEALYDEEWHVRKPAVFALGVLGAEAAKAIPDIEKRLDDYEEQVRIAAQSALNNIQLDMGNEKIRFWDAQRKGANGMGGANHDEWFKAASELGLEYIRLTPAEMKPAKKDFLIGDADHYEGIPEQDLKKLIEVLDVAQSYDVKIVLTMFGLPGARFRQHNDYKFDYRLWTDEKYQQQAFQFWKDLAGELKNHPAVVAYNPLNEPHPARKDGFESASPQFEQWKEKNEGGLADLNRFNRLMVSAIREVDLYTPIHLDGWFHASHEGIQYLEPLKDDRILYAFHFYEPWVFATYRINKGRFSYPDAMPVGDSNKTEPWTIDTIRYLFQPTVKWAKKNKVPANRIVLGEFGCDRRVEGAQQYLSHIIDTANSYNWHWAFYAFRSHTWDGLDYELGTKPLAGQYWTAREEGKSHEELIQRHDNPLFNVIKKELKK